MNRFLFKNIIGLLSCLMIFSIGALALELSLEDNKAESGTVGYVDIEIVFKKCSMTTIERDSFKDKIKEKEAFISGKKKKLFTLKAEIGQLKQEKEFALRLPLIIQTKKLLDEMSSSATQIAPSTSTARIDASTSIVSGSDIRTSTITPMNIKKSKPVIDMPGISNVPLDYFKFSVSTSAAVISDFIKTKQTELNKLEKEIEIYRHQAELELLDYENRQTERILGKIYMVLKELAVKEGVSVIIDKKSVLFGNSAVNLTDKLLLKLEEDPL